MPTPNPEAAGASLPIEHDAPAVSRAYTAWHHFLARALEKTKAPGFDVQCFVRLGTLPLEADVILLRLHEHADTRVFAKHFSFLVPALRKYLLIEYKSPDDRLTLADLDTVRAYAMLCKRKYQVEHDEDVAVAMLYSRTETDFFAGCARNGWPLSEIQPGVRCSSNHHPMALYAVDLVTVGEQQPMHPINLLSLRRRQYKHLGPQEAQGPFGVLYEEIFLRELKKMSQMHVPGQEEVLDEHAQAVAHFLSIISLEERLQGISPEERLRDLSPEERLRDLSPEEMLRSLGAAERARLLELLLQAEKTGSK